MKVSWSVKACKISTGLHKRRQNSLLTFFSCPSCFNSPERQVGRTAHFTDQRHDGIKKMLQSPLFVPHGTGRADYSTKKMAKKILIW